MTLSRRARKSEQIQMRVDRRTKRILAADAARRGKTVTELLFDAWVAYSPAAAALGRAA